MIYSQVGESYIDTQDILYLTPFFGKITQSARVVKMFIGYYRMSWGGGRRTSLDKGARKSSQKTC